MSMLPPPAPLRTDLWQQVSDWLGSHFLAAQAIEVGALLTAGTLILLLTRLVLLRVIRRLVKRTRFTWDDAFVDASFFRWLSQIIPAYAVHLLVPVMPHLDPSVTHVLQDVTLAFVAFSAMLALGALLNAINTIYQRTAAAHSRPIKGYVQIAKIFVYVVGTVVTVALLAGKNPVNFIAGIGAFTAILLLIFKDTILSLVASIQLTSNDMVRVGDWIEMPSTRADGDVIDIALHTVKVQNWDKTISTIPTYKLISDSFKNWRGMQMSGGRRIKRSFNVDMSTIRFLDDEDIERFSRFKLLEEYMATKRRELEEYNARHEATEEVAANARHLTNIGTLRAYIIAYLRQHPDIHQKMTFLVRQLQPTEYGLPIELYIFSSETAWVAYERIQADVFDHILAILPEFGLRVFQRPAGSDMGKFLTTTTGHA